MSGEFPQAECGELFRKYLLDNPSLKHEERKPLHFVFDLWKQKFPTLEGSLSTVLFYWARRGYVQVSGGEKIHYSAKFEKGGDQAPIPAVAAASTTTKSAAAITAAPSSPEFLIQVSEAFRRHLLADDEFLKSGSVSRFSLQYRSWLKDQGLSMILLPRDVLGQWHKSGYIGAKWNSSVTLLPAFSAVKSTPAAVSPAPIPAPAAAPPTAASSSKEELCADYFRQYLLDNRALCARNISALHNSLEALKAKQPIYVPASLKLRDVLIEWAKKGLIDPYYQTNVTFLPTFFSTPTKFATSVEGGGPGIPPSPPSSSSANQTLINASSSSFSASMLLDIAGVGKKDATSIASQFRSLMMRNRGLCINDLLRLSMVYDAWVMQENLACGISFAQVLQMWQINGVVTLQDGRLNYNPTFYDESLQLIDISSTPSPKTSSASSARGGGGGVDALVALAGGAASNSTPAAAVIDEHHLNEVTLGQTLARLGSKSGAANNDDDDDEDEDEEDEDDFEDATFDPRKQGSLFCMSAGEQVPEFSGLFGTITHKFPGQKPIVKNVHLNVKNPFCAIMMGVQGAGKSHSMASIIENCMLSCPGTCSVPTPITTLVLHYDQLETNFCEAATLVVPSPHAPLPTHLNRSQMDVLVSPNFYRQRVRFYKDLEVNVYPLLFRWEEVTAAQLHSLMRVDESDSPPLYMECVMDVLRRYQRSEKRMPYFEFRKEIQKGLNPQQSMMLKERLRILETFLDVAEVNEDLKGFTKGDLWRSGRLILADLTDPLLQPKDANSVFQILLEQFRSCDLRGSEKLVCLDEAHKYLSESSSALSRTLVDIVRQMRHLGMRVAVSTQSPLVIPAEMLELVSMAVVHKFFSRDWFSHLKRKIPLSEDAFREILSLRTGDALVFAPSSDLQMEDFDDRLGNLVARIRVRQRLTFDGGLSRMARAGN